MIFNRKKKTIEKNKVELQEFIEKLESSFFIDLVSYKKYMINGFAVDDLSFLELISICELCEVSDITSLFDRPRLSQVFGRAMKKLLDCSDDEIKAKVFECLKDLECFNKRVGNEREKDIDDIVDETIEESPYFSRFNMSEDNKKDSSFI